METKELYMTNLAKLKLMVGTSLIAKNNGSFQAAVLEVTKQCIWKKLICEVEKVTHMAILKNIIY